MRNTFIDVHMQQSPKNVPITKLQTTEELRVGLNDGERI